MSDEYVPVSHHMACISSYAYMNYWCPLIINDEWLIDIVIFIIVQNVARNIYGDIMTWLVDHEYRDFYVMLAAKLQRSHF